MKKSYFAKKQVSGSLFLSFKAIAKAVVKCLKVVFAKRTILIVTDKKIRSINFGLVSQVVILSATIWVGNLFYNDNFNVEEEIAFT